MQLIGTHKLFLLTPINFYQVCIQTIYVTDVSHFARWDYIFPIYISCHKKNFFFSSNNVSLQTHPRLVLLLFVNALHEYERCCHHSYRIALLAHIPAALPRPLSTHLRKTWQKNRILRNGRISKTMCSVLLPHFVHVYVCEVVGVGSA